MVGDACQAVSLVAGQGASLAMAGAYVLAGTLVSSARPAEAFVRYESRVRPFATQQQEAGRKFAHWFLPSSPWRLTVRDAVMKVASLPGGAWVLKRELTTPSLFAP